MPKKKAAEAAKKSKADQVPAEVATNIAEATPKSAAETISKADAVRKALAAGKDNPTEGSIYIQAEFGLDVPPQVFSTYKTIEKKKAEGSKSARAAKVIEPETKPVGKAPKGDTVEFVRQIKDLVDQYGVEAVKDLAQVFAK